MPFSANIKLSPEYGSYYFKVFGVALLVQIKSITVTGTLEKRLPHQRMLLKFLDLFVFSPEMNTVMISNKEFQTSFT